MGKIAQVLTQLDLHCHMCNLEDNREMLALAPKNRGQLPAFSV
jgi:hypothetical protein